MTFSAHVPNEITFSLVLQSNNFIADRTFPREIIVTFHKLVPPSHAGLNLLLYCFDWDLFRLAGPDEVADDWCGINLVRANFLWEHFVVFNLIRIKLHKNNAAV